MSTEERRNRALLAAPSLDDDVGEVRSAIHAAEVDCYPGKDAHEALDRLVARIPTTTKTERFDGKFVVMSGEAVENLSDADLAKQVRLAYREHGAERIYFVPTDRDVDPRLAELLGGES